MKHIDNGFVISSMTDINNNKDVVYKAMNIDQILQQNLKLSNYTDKIKTIILVFMAINPESGSFRPDKKFWRWKNGDFDMYVNVPDYKKFCDSTDKEARNMIAKLYLSSIETYLSKRKDINYKQLYTDVKEQFTKAKVL